eukprot:scaffold76062_cov36-Phaeocystis_antarctica.AAC.4
MQPSAARMPFSGRSPGHSSSSAQKGMCTFAPLQRIGCTAFRSPGCSMQADSRPVCSHRTHGARDSQAAVPRRPAMRECVCV